MNRDAAWLGCSIFANPGESLRADSDTHWEGCRQQTDLRASRGGVHVGPRARPQAPVAAPRAVSLSEAGCRSVRVRSAGSHELDDGEDSTDKGSLIIEEQDQEGTRAFAPVSALVAQRLQALTVAIDLGLGPWDPITLKQE